MTNDKSKLSKKEKDKAIEKIMDENAEQYKKFISSPFVDQYDEKGNKISYCVPPPGIIRILVEAYGEYYPEEYCTRFKAGELNDK